VVIGLVIGVTLIIVKKMYNSCITLNHFIMSNFENKPYLVGNSSFQIRIQVHCNDL